MVLIIEILSLTALFAAATFAFKGYKSRRKWNYYKERREEINID